MGRFHHAAAPLAAETSSRRRQRTWVATTAFTTPPRRWPPRPRDRQTSTESSASFTTSPQRWPPRRASDDQMKRAIYYFHHVATALAAKTAHGSDPAISAVDERVSRRGPARTPSAPSRTLSSRRRARRDAVERSSAAIAARLPLAAPRSSSCASRTEAGVARAVSTIAGEPTTRACGTAARCGDDKSSAARKGRTRRPFSAVSYI